VTGLVLAQTGLMHSRLPGWSDLPFEARPRPVVSLTGRTTSCQLPHRNRFSRSNNRATERGQQPIAKRVLCPGYPKAHRRGAQAT